ncbi:hypothetical protein JCM15519_00300 [Fundidesulfovibrio butyratiphilus]
MIPRELPTTAMIDGRCYQLDWTVSDNSDGFIAIVSLNNPIDENTDLSGVSVEKAISCGPIEGIDSISAHEDGEVVLYVRA